MAMLTSTSRTNPRCQVHHHQQLADLVLECEANDQTDEVGIYERIRIRGLPHSRTIAVARTVIPLPPGSRAWDRDAWIQYLQATDALSTQRRMEWIDKNSSAAFLSSYLSDAGAPAPASGRVRLEWDLDALAAAALSNVIGHRADLARLNQN